MEKKCERSTELFKKELVVPLDWGTGEVFEEGPVSTSSSSTEELVEE